LTEEQ
jgi:hypothetical protein